MGKKLIIKGADFSANGFHYETVKKEITALYKYDGTLAQVGDDVPGTDGLYVYENTSGEIKYGSSLAGAVSTKSGYDGDNIEVEDYTDAEVKSVNTIAPQGVIAGSAIMFFLDENGGIIGGLSTGDSLKGCVNKGTSQEERTFSMKVPASAKYVVCTVRAYQGGVVPAFKLTLSKTVLSQD